MEKKREKIKKHLLKIYPETCGNIDYIFDNGDTVLIRAIKSKNKIYIHNILQNTKKHNNANKNGWTALMYACKYDLLDIVKLLVEKYNVDIYKLNNKFNRAVHMSNDDTIKKYIEKMEKIQYAKADLIYESYRRNPYEDIMEKRCGKIVIL